MRSPVRAVAMIAAITGLAAVLMDAQAEAMERALERRQQARLEAAAVAAGGDALAAAVAAVESGRPVGASLRRLDTPAGALDVAVEARAQSRGTSVVRVRVTDAGGRELRSYETSVERMR